MLMVLLALVLVVELLEHLQHHLDDIRHHRTLLCPRLIDDLGFDNTAADYNLHTESTLADYS